MKVAVIVIGYRNPDDVKRCLTALSRSTYPHFSVVICENGGEMALDRLQREVPSVLSGGQVVHFHDCGGNLGFAGGVNRGISLTPDSDAWWILNPDTEPAPDALAQLIARLEKRDVDAVGGVLVLSNGRVQAFGGLWRAWLGRPVSLGQGSQPDDADPDLVEGRQNYILGASMFVSRRFVTLVGPMREDYFLYGEEIEWFLRARSVGMRLGFSATARILHMQGTTTGAGGSLRSRSIRSVYLDERNKLLIVRDTQPRRLAFVSLATLGLLIARFGRGRAWPQLGAALQGWAAGLLGKRGKPSWVQ